MHQASRVVVTEAWMLNSPKPLGMERLDREGVECQPGRSEVVLIMGEDATEGGVMAQMPIVRQGRNAKLDPLRFVKYDTGEGRMIGLLPQAGAAH